MTTRRGPAARTPALLAGAFLALLLALAACNRAPAPAGPLRIIVTIAPLTGLVRSLAPEGAEIRTLIPPGRSLHGYELAPADLAALASADLVISVGLNLEPAVDDCLADHPSKTRRAVRFADIAGLAADPADEEPSDHESEARTDDGHADDEHAEDNHADHDHGPIDPHLWLDPDLIARLIPAIADALEASLDSRGRLTPAERTRLASAAQDLTAKVNQIDAAYRDRLAPFAGAAIVTHHNAFSRIAARYNLRIAAVIRPMEGNEPTPGHLAQAIDAIRAENARAVFFEPQFDPDLARTIAQRAGVRLGTLDPEGNTDWFALMRANLDELTTILAP